MFKASPVFMNELLPDTEEIFGNPLAPRHSNSHGRGQNKNKKFPLYDLLKFSENSYRLQIAVAGFSEGDLSVTDDENHLYVKGSKTKTTQCEYLKKGISTRDFVLSFPYGRNYVNIQEVSLEDGLLKIDFEPKNLSYSNTQSYSINVKE